MFVSPGTGIALMHCITAMMLRPDQSSQPAGSESAPAAGHRLNLLLSCTVGRHQPASTIDQLPPLLAPLGVRTLHASCGEEAADVIRQFHVHIAVVDISLPLQRTSSAASPASEAGSRVLQLLRRLDVPPPTVVVRPPQPVARESTRGLTQALREGAFAVLDQPVGLEAMLEVLRRILRRHYADLWPQ